ncbi:hypothetical protein PG102015_1263 [Bifidobacterium pseudolongum subsp. globosum]|nr:hypothetical protein PG102015_1263 [Bifidobacterium pseudolongum subsp. globosum]
MKLRSRDFGDPEHGSIRCIVRLSSMKLRSRDFGDLRGAPMVAIPCVILNEAPKPRLRRCPDRLARWSSCNRLLNEAPKPRLRRFRHGCIGLVEVIRSSMKLRSRDFGDFDAVFLRPLYDVVSSMKLRSRDFGDAHPVLRDGEQTVSSMKLRSRDFGDSPKRVRMLDVGAILNEAPKPRLRRSPATVIAQAPSGALLNEAPKPRLRR